MRPRDGGTHCQELEKSATESSSMHSGNEQQSMQQNSSNIGDSSHSASRHSSVLGPVASAVSAFVAAKDIMETLRSKHSNLASELEKRGSEVEDHEVVEILLTEIGSRFMTLREERLLSAVNALLHRCYKYPIATTAEVPQSLKNELSEVYRFFFSANVFNKHAEFLREYKQEFERDLDPKSTTTFPCTLSELTERLKNWKNILLSNETEPDHRVKLEQVGADIPIVRRHGSSFRSLTLFGSDGSQRHFIVQTSLTPNAKSDERILQLFRVMNQMFEKHKESRRRHLYIHTPIIIPVWS
ncbi:hypothetical protein SAY87_015006 [Trapa incisa]|uniref:PI3K/PI4K catalytic domain-containing protein n=1 Tax=Trapa incisa TaxID=236973 RepID=A0AAN7JLL9_9MYRT|nr:hypothetical protein SAY87_015006 [Trapa incisa]